MGKRTMKTAADLGAETVEILDYVYAGTSKAADYLGADGFADVSCVCCGAKISHVFWSNVGPLGGDCAATLTGDNSTRAKVRVHVEKCYRRVRYGKLGALHVDGASIGQRTPWGKWSHIVTAPSHRVALMIAGAAAERYASEFGVVANFVDENRVA